MTALTERVSSSGQASPYRAPRKIDAGQPWRRSIEGNVIYTDWKRDNYWHAVASQIGGARRIGIESDHMPLAARDTAPRILGEPELVDIASDTITARMVKSAEEIEHRENDILVVTEDGAENITGLPHGPEHNSVGA